MERTLEYLPLESLVEAPRNPRTHDFGALAASVDRFGYVEPIVMDERTSRLVAGHGRLRLLWKRYKAGDEPPAGVRLQGGSWHVPVLRGWSSKDDWDAEAYLLASNRTAELTGWDDDLLTKMLEDLKQWDSLEGTGFTLEEGKGGGEDPPEPPATAPARTKPGDLWLCGPHRVLCGDATDPDDLDRVLDGARNCLAVYSPPYNIASSKVAGQKYDAEVDDDMDPDAWRDLICDATDNVLRHSAFAFMNVQMVGSNKVAMVEALGGLSDKLADVIVWDKGHGQPAMGQNILNSCFEFVWVFAPGPNPKRTLGMTPFRGTIDNVYRGSNHNTLAAQHQATFPVHLPQWVIEMFAAPDTVIIDTFAGTGTTMLAADLTGHASAMVEKHPGYVDLMIARWEEYAESPAVLLEE